VIIVEDEEEEKEEWKDEKAVLSSTDPLSNQLLGAFLETVDCKPYIFGGGTFMTSTLSAGDYEEGEGE
jgi:hypothetical protein